MRFTTRTLIFATILVALALVLRLQGLVLMYLALGAALLGVRACSYLSNKLRLAVADRFTPHLYSRPLFTLLRWICGRRAVAWALCKHAAGLCADGHYDDAVVAHTRVLALEANWADYWVHRGVARYHAGDRTAAEHDFAKAIALNRGCEIALAYRGIILFHQGHIREALGDLRRVRCQDSWYVSAAHTRGNCHERLGQWQAAFDDYRLAHELDPSETRAGLALARLQSGCPVPEFRDGAKAVDNAYRMCVRTGWKDSVALSVLAAAHAEQGEFDQAVAFTSQALELASDATKPELQQLLDQFRNRVPFRIPQPEQSDTTSVL